MGIKDLFSFILSDLKSDWQTVKGIVNGTLKPKHTLRELFGNPVQIIKDNWLLLVLMTAVFLAGYWLGDFHGQVKTINRCMDYIQLHYLNSNDPFSAIRNANLTSLMQNLTQ
jgi:hypothetical protein